ncbi:HXXEE domain-containing protein [Necropsobacter massiliensis]|uniref:HXXEE domain-containing protein n=1 Tax=Necropsobacter massiliensis TaxID=1400001 RepID=UPI000660791B|nr:HXXEE domain-containing protein [Necropsobacter massiliensis]
MHFLLKNWYKISLPIGLLIMLFTALTWQHWHFLQALALLNLGVIFLHFFEEFGFPGGFPKFANTMFAMKNSPQPDRYPLNQMSALWINYGTAIFMYLTPVFFPNQIWFGLMPILFGGVAQLLIHGVVNNVMLKTYYNSGLATTLFGHLPIMTAYIYYIEINHLAHWYDYAIGAALMVAWYVGVVRILIPKIWQRLDSPYPFIKEEMNRFDTLYPHLGKNKD